MPTTPTGDLALTLYNLETLVAESATFQTAVGATGTTAQKIATARTRIYWPGQSLASPILRPFACIKLRDGAQFSGPDSGGDGFYPTLPLAVLLECAAVDGDDSKERAVKAWNFFGGVLGDMQALAKTVGHLEVTQFTVESIAQSDPKETDKYDQAMIALGVF